MHFVFNCICAAIFCRSHPRVEFLDLASHSFQFGFAHAAFPFSSSSLQQFDFFFILSNTVFLVIQFSLQAYVLQSSQKILYFFSKKKKRSCNSVSGLILQSPR